MIILTGWLAILIYFVISYRKGVKKHRAVRTGFLRYTTRDSKGRFTGNNVSIWEIL